jgi:hypothetical protein
MELHNCSSSLTQLAEELILDAQDTLIQVILRAEDAFDELEVAREILIFSQSRALSRDQIHPTVSTPLRTYNSSVNTSSVHPRLRKCWKHANLRDICTGIAEVRKMEIKHVKPKEIYITKPT